MLHTPNYEVEIENSKRFNDKGLETHRKSETTRTSGDGTKTYHVYSGDLWEAEPSDFTSMDTIRSLGTKLLSDLYADERHTEGGRKGQPWDWRDAICYALNSNQLRLAYGDRIKSLAKTGVSGRNLATAANDWLMDQPIEVFAKIQGEYKALRAKDEAAAKSWLIEQYVTANRPK